MHKKEFQAETKRLLEIVINSIYTNKDIFLRELISNASDAIDKVYYRALTDDAITFNQEDFYITISADKENRQLIIKDTGIGMTQEELENNIGVIAKSGSLAFKQENELKDGYDIIGQFGVGFYAAFMVAEEITVISKAFGNEEAYRWVSKGTDGYSIEPCEKEHYGTDVILSLKPNADEEDYDQYLEEHTLRSLVKKYSDFIRYPIKMNVTRSQKKEGTEDEFEDVIEEQILNSMVPIWKKNKNELTPEDYEQFYFEKRFGFDKPLRHMHINTEGTVSYRAVLFIPEKAPFDFYTREYEKGLELYSSGVLIMEKCAELLPDYFSFVKGVVDSEDLSLNISREMLQHDRQLKVIAKNLKSKIKKELLDLMENAREDYEKFYDSFGRQLKYGVYSDFGTHKDDLQDLLMFHSSKEGKLVSLKDYVSRMPEAQKEIYYAAGDSVSRIEKMPQTELIKDKGYEILYFTEDVDEFAIKMLNEYQEKPFKSVASGDLDLDDEKDKESEEAEKEHESLFSNMKELLSDQIKSVKASKRLKQHPVCLVNEGDISIEMEKVLSSMPNDQEVKADKILEVNMNHEVFQSLKSAYQEDQEKFQLFTELLYQQARMIEGLPVDDPVELSNKICKIMK
ncbi:molecular chaperone HtpG [Tindallia californiensis]|uniref:Chaperone protein HtpG n=1 Tax=Tindallia californiensis TaxID=159292 RepID=A0A1H3KFC2_9FIRM|nr:molecular chaperone HtpG [Tindallia californiensis]SDY50515.1 molecular chaperone HtpG [Tindallia californiensis]